VNTFSSYSNPFQYIPYSSIEFDRRIDIAISIDVIAVDAPMAIC
jgi:hypothetical protein